MVSTEQEALAFAVTECAIRGTEWIISGSDGGVVWTIERDSKVNDDDLAWPVIAHLRGGLSSGAFAVVTEVGVN